VNSDHYVLYPFFNQLSVKKRQHVFFQQDDATTHTDKACLRAEVVTFNTLYKARSVCVIFLQYSYKCVQAGKLTSGNQRATAFSLAAKGKVVAEKRRTRCPLKCRFLIRGTHCINPEHFSTCRVPIYMFFF
jgi:hypothetical protein